MFTVSVFTFINPISNSTKALLNYSKVLTDKPPLVSLARYKAALCYCPFLPLSVKYVQLSYALLLFPEYDVSGILINHI